MKKAITLIIVVLSLLTLQQRAQAQCTPDTNSCDYMGHYANLFCIGADPMPQGVVNVSYNGVCTIRFKKRSNYLGMVLNIDSVEVVEVGNVNPGLVITHKSGKPGDTTMYHAPSASVGPYMCYRFTGTPIKRASNALRDTITFKFKINNSISVPGPLDSTIVKVTMPITDQFLASYVDEATHNLSFSLSPNPAQTSTSILLDLPAPTPLECKIFNMNGGMVYNTQVATSAGENRISLPTDNFSNGMYLVKITGDNFQGTQKLIINK